MLKSIAFLTAVSMVSYFNPNILSQESTETYEDQGFQNYEYHHTFGSGRFDSPGSRLDGCLKYTTINDVIFYDYPEIHENYDTLVVGSETAPGYLSSLQKENKGLSEYYLLCPLETSKTVDMETKTIQDSGNYIIKAVWQETPEIAVYSENQEVPVDVDKLKELLPEATIRPSDSQNVNGGCVFHITTNPTRNVAYASELDHLLTEDDVRSVIECRKDNLTSVQFEGNWFCNTIILPASPDFSADESKTVYDFYTSKNIGFSITDCEYNENRKTIVFDEEIPAAEYLELEFELGEKSGITGGQLSYYDAEDKSSVGDPVEYFDIAEGDANDDGELSLADAIYILQCIGNPEKYHFTPQGKVNADVFCPGDGITASDALSVQQKLLGLIDALPVCL